MRFNRAKGILLVLDGLSREVVRNGISEDWLPNIGRLARAGTVANLLSTVPPDTGAAVATLMTGADPTIHGIFSMVTPEVRGSKLVLTPASLGKVAVPSIFDAAESLNLRVAAFGIPLLRPTPKVKGGFAVPGFGVPETFEAHPSWVQSFLNSAGFERDVPSEFYRIDPAEKAKVLVERLDLTADLFLELVSKLERLDLAIVWFPETDRAGHTLWGRTDLLYSVYRAADRVVGKIADYFDPRESLLVVAGDHGFTDYQREFYPNWCFFRAGWLRIRGGISGSLRKMASILGEAVASRVGILRGAAAGAMDAAFWKGQKGALSEAIRRIIADYGDVDASKSLAIALAGGTPYFLVYLLSELMGEAPSELERRRLLSEMVKMPCLLDFAEDILPPEEVYGSRPKQGLERPSPAAIVKVRGGVCPRTRISASLWKHTKVISGGMHARETLAIISGITAKASSESQTIHLRDLLPTLLHGSGLPLWEGMQGRPAVAVLSETIASPRWIRLPARVMLRSRVRSSRRLGGRR